MPLALRLPISLKRLRACVELLLQPVQALKCSGAGGAEQNRGGALPPHPRAPTAVKSSGMHFFTRSSLVLS